MSVTHCGLYCADGEDTHQHSVWLPSLHMLANAPSPGMYVPEETQVDVALQRLRQISHWSSTPEFSMGGMQPLARCTSTAAQHKGCQQPLGTGGIPPQQTSFSSIVSSLRAQQGTCAQASKSCPANALAGQPQGGKKWHGIHRRLTLEWDDKVTDAKLASLWREQSSSASQPSWTTDVAQWSLPPIPEASESSTSGSTGGARSRTRCMMQDQEHTGMLEYGAPCEGNTSSHSSSQAHTTLHEVIAEIQSNDSQRRTPDVAGSTAAAGDTLLPWTINTRRLAGVTNAPSMQHMQQPAAVQSRSVQQVATSAVYLSDARPAVLNELTAGSTSTDRSCSHGAHPSFRRRTLP